MLTGLAKELDYFVLMLSFYNWLRIHTPSPLSLTHTHILTHTIKECVGANKS